MSGNVTMVRSDEDSKTLGVLILLLDQGQYQGVAGRNLRRIQLRDLQREGVLFHMSPISPDVLAFGYEHHAGGQFGPNCSVWIQCPAPPEKTNELWRMRSSTTTGDE
ncbi:hypothetical protein FOZ62_023230 [Perkinsus olseni]|nr:hypothetical protein FOZ62_023230 [Perkinsus olseni]